MHSGSRGAAGNRLAGETSPYLLQHAANPVDWHPWGEAAIARARDEDRPILLSIGYSACHWCHVMAHESFEDAATAAVMNRHFVNVKLDREERPDLDKVYQLAHQMLTRRGGGWPLTMFLDPGDLTPFFGGTYFPREARHGLPAFRDLLERIAAVWQTQRADIASQNAALREAFAEILPGTAPGDAAPTRTPIAAARRQLAAAFDDRHGGFGPAPKFPHAPSLELLLREWRAGATPDEEAGHMAVLTLRCMTEGGLFDQVGGGFCRYAVDPYWRIPHFEKMLYDNGALLGLCAQAAAATGDAQLREAALLTGDWALREMRAPGGGFHAALDADSEGHEGRFYVWQREELERLLDAGEFRALAVRYGLDGEPNFEGAWHLHAAATLEEVAAATGLAPEAARERLARARAKLLAARSRRVRPGLDDKVLTAWNALMARGLLVAGRLLAQPQFTAAALDALDFLRENAWRDGQLFAAWKGGAARFPAYLDDHAFLLDALLEALQSRFRPADLAFAAALAEALLDRFEDRDRGGFWFTAAGADTPLGRPKSFADDAMASGNGVAAQALARLGWLTGDARCLEAAGRAVRAAYPALERAPMAHATMLNALDEHLAPVEIVVIRGRAPDLERWRDALAAAYAPRRLVFALPDDAAGLTAALAARRPREGTVAYVCRGPACSAPVERLETLSASPP